MLTPVSASEAHTFLRFNMFHLCFLSQGSQVLSPFLGEQQPGGSDCLRRGEVEGVLERMGENQLHNKNPLNSLSLLKPPNVDCTIMFK